MVGFQIKFISGKGISSGLNPDIHNTRTLYVQLFPFAQHVSAIVFSHHHVEDTST